MDFRLSCIEIYEFMSSGVKFLANLKLFFCLIASNSYSYLGSFNDTHRENCVLLSSVQEFIEIEDWLLLTFFLCLHNQLIAIYPIVAY